MPIERQRVSLCRFLRTLAEEKQISVSELAERTGISVAELQSMLNGDHSPTVDQLITVANELDMQLTFQQSISFAHRKAANQVK
ncbi:helix-turn-helix transcriptional regulator [Sediminibacterium roseum]|uniref:Helix-turn-helix transcriptional regulator n=1 Tax=Sediminibacterium roseum TaxID=1978412 RepID=A0ABW9ZS81_9BACT|nr:helix-turn-helix transcriptional regulator [Sediminibacterium roseum]NCI49964.1 helix-turn-helix transcriptional regulator [Sediminibacterium roseum]